MTGHPAAPAEDHLRRLAQASGWRVALAEADAATAPGFEAWLAADPANAAAWDRVQAGWVHVGDHAGSAELLALREAALARARQHGAATRAAPRSRLLSLAASVVLLLLAAGAVYAALGWWQARPVTYATALGERRVVTLADGSRVSLDAASTLQVSYRPDVRRLALLRGQARFDVARDPARPFTVQAGDRTVVATGTAFTVDLLGPRVKVTLLEGRVVVLDRADVPRDDAARLIAAAHRRLPPPGPAVTTLDPGQELTLAPAAPPLLATIPLDRATAWEQGQLVFDDEPLDAVAARVSRYAARPVTVAPAVAGLRLSGVFTAGDTATFVDTVGRYLPVRAIPQPDGSVMLERRGE